jgi:tRNA (cytidine/uridine-2'-O-)-methyltransferase
MLHIVLYQPEIPHNTGAAGRLCLATGSRLHLIKPLGFSLDDKHLKRTGLDYWREVDVHVWESWEALRASADPQILWFFLTTKATREHWDASFPAECYLVFGPETRGLPESMLREHADTCLRIPMQGTRSLNLATSAGIVMYEALRQQRHGALK